MFNKRFNYILIKSIIPITILLIFFVMSYLFPIVQVIYPILSLLILIYMTVIFAIYESYEGLRNKLFYLCDEIKNDVAKNEIVETNDYGIKLVKYISEATVNFGVDGVIFKAVDSNYIYSDREKIIKNITITDYEKLNEKAQRSSKLQIVKREKKEFGFKYRSILIVPIVFENIYLGYFALCSLKKIFGDLDVSMYNALENYLIDDAFYSLKDRRIKNKIIKLEMKVKDVTTQFASVKTKRADTFLDQLSKLITLELDCSGGYFYLRPSNFNYYPDSLQLDFIFFKNLDNVFRDKLQPQIIDKNDPNFNNKLPFPILISIPIIFEKKYLGSFGVFLNDENRINETKSILNHIENSVLDNYINMFLDGR